MSILNTNKIMPVLQGNQNRINRLTLDVTSGVKIHRPSDDPVASARLLDVKTTISSNGQYVSNAESAGTVLALQDTSLAQMTESLQTIRESVMESMNAPTSPEQIKIQAIKTKSGMDELLTQANMTTPYGYLYSGFSEQAPFTETPTGATYSGDDNIRQVRISDSATLRTSFTGNELFRSNDPSNDMFKLVSEIRTQMESGSMPTAKAQDWLKRLDNQIAHVTNMRAQGGVRMNEVDNIVDRYTNRNVALRQEQSNLEDTDVAQALIEMNTRKTAVEAAYKTIATMDGVSIFNFMN